MKHSPILRTDRTERTMDLARILPCAGLALLALSAMLVVAASAETPESRPLSSWVPQDASADEPWTESFRLAGNELASTRADEGTTAFLSSFETEAPRRWWPVLLSAAVPGLGETLTGHKRGWLMIPADLGLWTMVKNQSDKGNDKEVEFEAFADAHWSQEEWEYALANPGDIHDYFDVPVGSGPENVALYVSRADDEREWYENLGKWDVFAWGWEEYWVDGWDPENNSLGGSLGNPVFNTPLRQQYIDLRGESNDAFRNRDRFLTAALLFRVVSMLQMAYLEGFIGGRYDGATAEANGPSSGWYVEPEGLSGAQLGWKVSY